MRANLGRAFGESWNNYLPNIGVCIAAWIVGFVIIIVTLGILTGPIMGGFVRMGQRMKRGEKVDFNDLFFGFSRFGDFFLYGIFTLILVLIVGGINLVLSLIPLLGQLASLVIVMLFGAVVVLGLVHMVEKSASVSEGFGMGFRLLSSSPLDVLVGGGLLTLVGLVLPIITLLWATTGFFYLYEDLTTGPAPAQVPPPPPPPPAGGEGGGQAPPPPSGEPPAPPPPPGGEGGQPGVERPEGEGKRPGQPPA